MGYNSSSGFVGSPNRESVSLFGCNNLKGLSVLCEDIGMDVIVTGDD